VDIKKRAGRDSGMCVARWYVELINAAVNKRGVSKSLRGGPGRVTTCARCARGGERETKTQTRL
jgi:hypothetical protein